VSLRTVEDAYGHEIELSSSEVVLFSSSSSSSSRSILPSSFPFAIPLTPDTPQSLRTPHSSLSHVLTATLHPSGPAVPPIKKTMAVQTKRFVSHSYTPAIHPETHSLDDPTRVEVQIPRTTFKAGEEIPLYVTVPPPQRNLVLEQGLRLRNIKAELVRFVQVKRVDSGGELVEGEGGTDVGIEPSASHGPPMVAATSMVLEKRSAAASSFQEPTDPSFLGESYRNVVAQTGASCRFHSIKPVRLRFVLHQPAHSDSLLGFQADFPPTPSFHHHPEEGMGFPPITQMTLLHSVTFRINIHISFVDMTTHMERISTVSIPIVIIALPAPLPEVEDSLEVAYQKKHDRPPARTVRYDDTESSAPHYDEGAAGPSFLNTGAPPPFEERDAPPPFFSHAAESSTAGRLPTFLESEAEIIVPQDDQRPLTEQSPPPAMIAGEGEQFGFPASQQFDGHSEDILQRSSTPPPTLEMATMDTNVTGLADIDRQEHVMDALNMALEQRDEGVAGEHPPPPPAMDDPSDPPPSIDSDFRSPGPPRQSPSPRLVASTPPTGLVPPPARPGVESPSESHAPPPYLIPDVESDQAHVTRPPPYMDWVTAGSSQ
jgi:neural Wiskott-Aldrich syndrome protein